MTRPICWLRWLMVASSYGTTPMLSTQIKICWPKLCTRKIPGELMHCVCFWRLVTLLGVSIFVGWTPIFEFNNKRKISYCHWNKYINPCHVDPIFWTNWIHTPYILLSWLLVFSIPVKSVVLVFLMEKKSLLSLQITVIIIQRSCWGYIGFTPSVRPSRVRPASVPHHLSAL